MSCDVMCTFAVYCDVVVGEGLADEVGHDAAVEGMPVKQKGVSEGKEGMHVMQKGVSGGRGRVKG